MIKWLDEDWLYCRIPCWSHKNDWWTLEKKSLTFDIQRVVVGFLSIARSILDEEPKEFDWEFVENRTLVKLSTNDVYYNIVVRHVWMGETINFFWGFSNPISGGITWLRWLEILERLWWGLALGRCITPKKNCEWNGGFFAEWRLLCMGLFIVQYQRMIGK